MFFFFHDLSGQSCGGPPPGSPGGDNADDNLSYSSGSSCSFYFVTPDHLIYKKGYYESYEKQEFFKRGNAFTDLKNGCRELIGVGTVLVLPTGSLFEGGVHDESLKITLNEYVKQGGTLIVFAQQHGRNGLAPIQIIN